MIFFKGFLIILYILNTVCVCVCVCVCVRERERERERERDALIHTLNNGHHITYSTKLDSVPELKFLLY